jgi:membrane protease YdiL (CAAX protease family)
MCLNRQRDHTQSRWHALKMNVLKYILASILFILFLELLSYACWELYFNNISEEYYKYYLSIFSIIELLLVFLFVYSIGKRTIIKSLVFSKKYTLAAIALGFAYVFIQKPLNLIYNYLFNQNEFIIYDFVMTDITLWKFIGVVLFIPIAEELFFREFIQKGLYKLNMPKISILLSSLLFALIHLQFTSLFFSDLEISMGFHIAYIALFGGLISALLYHKSKSLIPSILFHVCWNLAVILV